MGKIWKNDHIKPGFWWGYNLISNMPYDSYLGMSEYGWYTPHIFIGT
jgi:hypothetical protein